MNKTTATFNEILKDVLENYPLISDVTEKVKIEIEILKVLNSLGTVEVDKIGENSAREALENAPTPKKENEAPAAEKPAAKPEPEKKAESNVSQEPAKPINAESLADEWTPEMKRMFEPTLNELMNFIKTAFARKLITREWLNDLANKASGGMITQFNSMNDIPPKFIKVFHDMVMQAWMIRKQELQNQAQNA